jgi:hypothetical protein
MPCEDTRMTSEPAHFTRTECGEFGSGMTTAVNNPAAQIDFANDPFPLRIT